MTIIGTVQRFLVFLICALQIGQTNHVIDNIHSIIAAAAVKFDSAQLEHLFLLIQKVRQYTLYIVQTALICKSFLSGIKIYLYLNPEMAR